MATLFHTRVRSNPPCGSHILELIIYRSLHAEKLLRAPHSPGRYLRCIWRGMLVRRCNLPGLRAVPHCVSAAPFFLSASLPSPLDCVRRSAKAETQRRGGGGDAAAAAADAHAHV